MTKQELIALAESGNAIIEVCAPLTYYRISAPAPDIEEIYVTVRDADTTLHEEGDGFFDGRRTTPLTRDEALRLVDAIFAPGQPMQPETNAFVRAVFDTLRHTS